VTVEDVQLLRREQRAQLADDLGVRDAPQPVHGAIGRGDLERRPRAIHAAEQAIDLARGVAVAGKHGIGMRAGLGDRGGRRIARGRIGLLVRPDMALGPRLQAHRAQQRLPRQRAAAVLEDLVIAVDRARAIACELAAREPLLDVGERARDHLGEVDPGRVPQRSPEPSDLRHDRNLS